MLRAKRAQLTTMAGRSYPIAGHVVYFPHAAYGVQLSFMSKVIQTLDSSGNALLEAPTGCGKTLSLLCGALAWQKKYKETLRQQQEAEMAARGEQAAAQPGAPPSKGGDKPIKGCVAHGLLNNFMFNMSGVMHYDVMQLQTTFVGLMQGMATVLLHPQSIVTACLLPLNVLFRFDNSSINQGNTSSSAAQQRPTCHKRWRPAHPR